MIYQKKFINLRKIFVFIVLALSVISLIPLYWMLLNSLQPNTITMKIPPDIIPKSVDFNNYAHIFKNTSFLRWIFNSIFVCCVSFITMVYLAVLAGYPLAKKDFPGRKVLFWTAVAFMAVPRQVLLVPLFVTMKNLNLYDTITAMILPNLAWPFGIFLMKQIISTIPNEIFDAANIDGASEFRTLNSILIPMIKPGIAAASIFAFTHVWNDFMWQLIIIKSDLKKTVNVGIVGFADEFVANYGLQMAGGVLAAVPLVIIFIAFQKYFVGGITMGAVKRMLILNWFGYL